MRKSRHTNMGRVVFTLAFIFLFVRFIPAQSFLSQNLPAESGYFRFTFMRPLFTEENDFPAYAGIYDISFNIVLSRQFGLLLSIPYLTSSYLYRSGFDYYPITDPSDDGFGNLCIGLQTRNGYNDKNGWVGSVLLYLPTAHKESENFGIITNYTDYFKYLYEMVTIYGNYVYRKSLSAQKYVGLEVGPAISVPIGKENRDALLFIRYGIMAGYNLGRIVLSSELIGVARINQYTSDFTERFVHVIDFGAMYRAKNIRAGLYYNFYLKDTLNKQVKGVVGLKIELGGY